MMNQTLQLHNANLFFAGIPVSLAACMYIGSVDSSKLPYYFLTGTIC